MRAHTTIAEKYQALRLGRNARARRLWAATEAWARGHGGLSAVARATGLSHPTIRAGSRERRGDAVVAAGTRVRRPGGGRQCAGAQDPTLLSDVEAWVQSTTRGDPQSPLRWTCKRVRRLAAELQAKGHQVSQQLVSKLLHQADYRRQGARKPRAGGPPPDRDAQFAHIARRVRHFQSRGQPGISVDAKKKELGGDFKHAGREWPLQGEAPEGSVYDVIDPALGKAIPYGVYDVHAHLGWVSVGVDHDTPAFAVATIRAWWRQMGSPMYPKAKELLITADRGGRNSARARLWKRALQRVADDSRLRIGVSPLPPGTSQGNKLEPRRFCHITANWRGKPLESRAGIISLLGSTSTSTGLRIQAALEAGQYPTGVKVTKTEMQELRLERSDCHGAWNDTMLPHDAPRSNPQTNAKIRKVSS